MSAHDSAPRLALSSSLATRFAAGRRQTATERQRDVGTAQRGEECGPRTDRTRERERAPRDRETEGRGERRGRRDGEAERAGETAREPLHEKKAEQQQQESAASGSAEQHFLERCCARRSKTRWPPGGAARLCLAARIAPGGTLGASAEGGRARGHARRGVSFFYNFTPSVHSERRRTGLGRQLRAGCWLRAYSLVCR